MPDSKLNLIQDEIKDIYYILLKYSPLSLSELSFLSKEKALEKILKKIDSLNNLGLIRIIEDEVPLYIALPPTILFQKQFDSILEEAKVFTKEIKEKNDDQYSNLEENNINLNGVNEFEQMITEVNSKHLLLIDEIDKNFSELVKNNLKIQESKLKDVSQIYSDTRQQTVNKISSLEQSANNDINSIITGIDEIISQIEEISISNKKNIRKSIQETIRSLDEGAHLVGKTFNDHIRIFEDNLVTTINSTISDNIEFTNSFKNQLISDYTQFKQNSGVWLNSIEEKNENMLSEALKSNLLNKVSDEILTELKSIFDNIKKIVDETHTKSQQASKVQYENFSTQINVNTKKYLDQIHSSKEMFDNTLEDSGSFNTFLKDYENEIKTSLRSFLNSSLLQSKENINAFNSMLVESKSVIKNTLEKEYSILSTERTDLFDNVTETIEKIKSIFDTQIVTQLENTLENGENQLKDLSVAIKRRYDKFSTDTDTLLQSINNKILDELLHIQGSNIELLESHATLKTEFNASFGNLIKEISQETISKNLEANNKLINNYIQKRKGELDAVNKNIGKLNSFLKTRHQSLEKQLLDDSHIFINNLKADLQIISSRMSSDLESEYEEYNKNLSDVKSKSIEIMQKQKEAVLNSIGSVSNSINSSIKDILSTITASFNSIQNNLSLELAGQKKIINDVYIEIDEEINSLVESNITRKYLDSSINNIKNIEVSYASKFEDAMTKNKEKLMEQYKLSTNQLGSRASTVFNDLTSYYTSIEDGLNNLNTNLNSDLTNLIKNLSNTLENINEKSSEHLDKFKELSESLESLTQKSKIDLETEMQTIDEELLKISNKNFETLEDQLGEFNSNFNKLIRDSTEVIKEDLNESYTSVSSDLENYKLESNERIENKLLKLDKISNKAINEFKLKHDENLKQIKEKKLHFDERSELLSNEIMSHIRVNVNEFTSKIDIIFETLDNDIPANTSLFLTNFKDKISQIVNFESLFANLNQNINNLHQDSESKFSENKKIFQKHIVKIKEDFSDQIESFGSEFRETSKLRLEEIEGQINDEIESFSKKLVKKEENDVKKLREIISTINTTVFSEIVNDNVIGTITPFRENIIQDIDNLKSQFNKILKSEKFSALSENHQATMGEISNLIINSFNESIGKINTIQNVFADSIEDFRVEFLEEIKTTFTQIKTKEEDLISTNKNQIDSYSKSQNKTIYDRIITIQETLLLWDKNLKSLSSNYHSLFSSLNEILEKSDTGDSIFKSRRIYVENDLALFLENVIARTTNTLNIVISKPDKLTLAPFIDIRTRARIKIVIKLGKSEKRKAWVQSLYKKKANVQIYESNKISSLILCVRDNEEVIVASEANSNGFIIQNKNFAEYFNSVVINNIISNSTPISRDML